MRAMTIFLAMESARNICDDYNVPAPLRKVRKEKFRQYHKFRHALFTKCERLDFLDEMARIKTGLDDEREES